MTAAVALALLLLLPIAAGARIGIGNNRVVSQRRGGGKPRNPNHGHSHGPNHSHGQESDTLFVGDSIRAFFMNQSAPGAVTEVPDPAGGGGIVFQMTVADHHVAPITPTVNPRAQLNSPPIIDPGEEIWWSSSFYLPHHFPSFVPGWLNLLQGPYGPPFNGSPPWQIQAVGDHLRWTRNGTYKWDVPWQMPLVKGRWIGVLVHMRLASDGFVEMWIDGERVTFFGGGTYNPHHVAATDRLSTQTLDRSNNGGPNSIFLQNYRLGGMFGSVTVYEGPLRIGTTRASVGG